MRLRSLAHPLAAALATGSAQLCPQAARGPPLPNPPPLAFFFPLPPVPRFSPPSSPSPSSRPLSPPFFSLSLVCFLSSRHSLNLRPFRFPSLFPGPFHSFGFISKACQSLLGRLRYSISIQPSPLFLARVPDHILSFWNSTPFSFWLYSLSLPTCSINTNHTCIRPPRAPIVAAFLTSFLLNPQRSSAPIASRGFGNRVAASRAIISPKQTAPTRHRPIGHER